jgi:hypothetical protein
MKRFAATLAAAAATSAMFAGLGHAADAAKAAEKPPRDEARPASGGQQNRMKACNAEAGKKQLKGEERRAFMSKCLKG